MKLVVLGATGGTGRALVDQALARDHQVTAIVRRPEAFSHTSPRLQITAGDVRASQTLVEPLRGADVAVSCVGVSGLLEARRGTDLYSAGTRSLLAAAREANLQRLIVVSSGGVTPQPHDGWFYRNVLKRFFLERMYADMRIMEDEVRASSLSWTIVRAPYLTNGAAREDVRTSADQPFSDDGNLTRASLAGFLLREAEAAAWPRRVVYVQH